MLVRAMTRVAPCEFTVNDDSRDTANAVILCFRGYLRLVHVVDHDPAHIEVQFRSLVTRPLHNDSSGFGSHESYEIVAVLESHRVIISVGGSSC
jgi:hypothetical protein